MNMQNIKVKLTNLVKYFNNAPRLMLLLFGILILVAVAKEITRETPKTKEQLQKEKYPHVTSYVAHFYENSKWEIISEEYDPENGNIDLYIEILYFGFPVRRLLSINHSDGLITSIKVDVHAFDNDIGIFGKR